MQTPEPLDLASAPGVINALRAGAAANFAASCRRGSIDVIAAPGALVATGDLHDNPRHFAAVVNAAGLDEHNPEQPPAHLTLHELIHGDNLIDDMDPSYRALVRAATLKAAHPNHVHVLLANHELSQIAGRGVLKNGVNCVKAFNAGVTYVFGDDAPGVLDALAAFIRSMPLALRCHTPGGDLLCAHSLPPPPGPAGDPDPFDHSILDRPLSEADYQPRTGSAHLMTWGRGHTPQWLETLASRWSVKGFILGHEFAPAGSIVLQPNAIVLNSDHEKGAICTLSIDQNPSIEYLARSCTPIAEFL